MDPLLAIIYIEEQEMNHSAFIPTDIVSGNVMHRALERKLQFILVSMHKKETFVMEKEMED